jgi:hypothetical protein
MQEITHYPHINVAIPFERIFRRLGYRSGTTDLSEVKKTQIMKKVEYAFDSMQLQGRSRVVSIETVEKDRIILEDSTIFQSQKLMRFLSGCQKTVIAGVTAGKNIMDEIQSALKSNNISDAAIYDAASSEIVDDALGWMIDLLRVQLRSQGEEIGTRRYSAGYGDFDLSNQAVFYSLLQLDQLDIVLTQEFLLLPEKTVTGLAGIKKN